jgi:hypothetical protein
VGLKLNGTHQLLAYAGDVNLLADDIESIKKNTRAVSDARKEFGLEINVDKSKYSYMLLSHHKIGTKKKQTDRLKMSHNSNVWERQ